MILIYLIDLLFAIPIILGLIALSKKLFKSIKTKEKKNEDDN